MWGGIWIFMITNCWTVIMYLILSFCLGKKTDHLSVPWSPRCRARPDSIYWWTHSCFMWNWFHVSINLFCFFTIILTHMFSYPCDSSDVNWNFVCSVSDFGMFPFLLLWTHMAGRKLLRWNFCAERFFIFFLKFSFGYTNFFLKLFP
jgi:hypothetical protein